MAHIPPVRNHSLCVTSLCIGIMNNYVHSFCTTIYIIFVLCSDSTVHALTTHIHMHAHTHTCTHTHTHTTHAHTCTRTRTRARTHTHTHRLLDSPVTAACGHSFCQECLSRSFDHTPFCPICRSPLAEVTHTHTYNELLLMRFRLTGGFC